MDADVDIVTSAPAELSKAEHDLFVSLVREGGEVGGHGLATNVANAKVLVFGKMAELTVGIAGLKRPQASYRNRIGRNTGFEIAESCYPFELGYVFVRLAARGRKVSHSLVAAALGSAESSGVFATTRTDNIAMLATLAKAGFEQAGQDYQGRGGRMIRLLVRRGGGAVVALAHGGSVK